MPLFDYAVTLRLPGGLANAVKQAARQRGVTLAQFIRDALRDALRVG